MRYSIEEHLDSLGQISHFQITAKGKFTKFLPRDNEFKDRESAEHWIAERLKKDRTNLQRAQYADAMRSFGMTKTPYGWE